MSRRKQRKKRRGARAKQPGVTTADLMCDIAEGRLLPIMRPQGHRALFLHSRRSGFEAEIEEDLSSQRRCMLALLAAELISFVAGAAAAVAVLGWWSVVVILAMMAGLAIVRMRSLYHPQSAVPLALLFVAGLVAGAFLWRYGPWSPVLPAAVPLTWLLRRISYNLSNRHFVVLVGTNPAAFSVLFASGVLALLKVDELEKAEQHGSLEDQPILITCKESGEHD